MNRITAATAVAALPLGLVAHGLLGAAPAQAAGGVVHIGFEDAPGHCLFNQTTALRDRYAAAQFRGPGALAGGGILDSTCGGWSQSAHGGNRFLAFNDAASYSDGGTPVGPQRIKFNNLKKMVSIWVSQNNNGGQATFTLVGKKGNAVVRKHTVSVNNNGWVELKVQRNKGMNNVVVRADLDSDGTWLADDLLMQNK
jgi:hypothetical protein